MSPKALKVCPTPGCPELVESGRCPTHRREIDQARGTAAARGYSGPGHTKRFRPGVLTKDPLCVLCLAEGRPPRLSTIADHWPLSRRELLERGMDPDDPANGRGLCKPCHDRATATNQPGGWAARPPGG